MIRLGISQTQLYFLEAFMIFCLLQQSPSIDASERRAIDSNEYKTAHQGRDPLLTLQRGEQQISLQDWGYELLQEMRGVCEILDEQSKHTYYTAALNEQIAAIKDASLTPSAKMLDEMRANEETFFEYASRYSQLHQKQLRNSALDENDLKFFKNVVGRSVEKQRQIEASDTASFEQFLDDYFSNTLSKKAAMA